MPFGQATGETSASSGAHFNKGSENPLSGQLAHMAGKLVLLAESPAGTAGQGQGCWFLATCVSPQASLA